MVPSATPAEAESLNPRSPWHWQSGADLATATHASAWCDTWSATAATET
jgi:hypothetical protein